MPLLETALHCVHPHHNHAWDQRLGEFRRWAEQREVELPNPDGFEHVATLSPKSIFGGPTRWLPKHGIDGQGLDGGRLDMGVLTPGDDVLFMTSAPDHWISKGHLRCFRVKIDEVMASDSPDGNVNLSGVLTCTNLPCKPVERAGEYANDSRPLIGGLMSLGLEQKEAGRPGTRFYNSAWFTDFSIQHNNFWHCGPPVGTPRMAENTYGRWLDIIRLARAS